MISQHAQQLESKLVEARSRRGHVWTSYYNARRAKRPLSELDALADELVRANAEVHDLKRELAIQQRRDELNSSTVETYLAESKSSALS